MISYHQETVFLYASTYLFINLYRIYSFIYAKMRLLYFLLLLFLKKKFQIKYIYSVIYLLFILILDSEISRIFFIQFVEMIQNVIDKVFSFELKSKCEKWKSKKKERAVFGVYLIVDIRWKEKVYVCHLLRTKHRLHQNTNKMENWTKARVT